MQVLRGFAHYFPLGSDYSDRVVGMKRGTFINTSMTNQQEKQLFESSKKFSDLYRSKVEYTGEKLRRLDEFDLPISPLDKITYTEIDEIAIKMPRDEYERFLQNWHQYLDLMYVAKYNQMIGEEYNKLLMLISLLR